MPRSTSANGRATSRRTASRTCCWRPRRKPASITVPLSKYAHFNTRICRAVGLGDASKQKVVDYALARIGKQYDSKQIVDLARYLFPYPPVPVWFRRRMLSIGSGDPTKAICSTLIAEAFASIQLSDPAGKRLDQRQDLRHRALRPERDRSHPHARSLHAARLRRVAVSSRS